MALPAYEVKVDPDKAQASGRGRQRDRTGSSLHGAMPEFWHCRTSGRTDS